MFPLLSQATDHWNDWRGRLCKEHLQQLGERLDQSDFYLCAGAAFSNNLKTLFEELNLKKLRLHSEAFAVSSGNAGDGFSLQLINSKQTLITQETLLQTLEAGGVSVRAECRAGDCGSCQLHIESGRVEWLLPPPAFIKENMALACCCRAASDLSCAIL